jgi:adenylosuccinate synthase
VGRAVIVVDLGFGDAGKGLVTDALVRRLGAAAVVRFNGGAQAGHNVIDVDGRHHTFSQLGAGTFVPGTATFLSRFVVLHPTALLVEAERLAHRRVADALALVTVDARALVTTPFHQAANRLRELARGGARHGSCGVGFGETVADARMGHAIVAGDLRDPARLRRALVETQERKRSELADAMAAAGPAGSTDRTVLESTAVVDAWLARAHAVTARIRIDDGAALGALLAGPRPVVFEGAQGVLLDEAYGFHPHTTWSTCTFANANALLSEHGVANEVLRLGVLRTYAIRHGAGPLPTHDPTLRDALVEPHNAEGPWQGPVRCGWPDFVLLRYAVAACGGIDALALTHVDALARLTSYRACEAYHRDGLAPLHELPLQPTEDLVHQEALTRLLEEVEPDYVCMPGDDDTVVDRFEAEARVPVALVARGPSAREVRIRQSV